MNYVIDNNIAHPISFPVDTLSISRYFVGQHLTYCGITVNFPKFINKLDTNMCICEICLLRYKTEKVARALGVNK